MPKSRLLEAEIGDLARPVKVVTGLRLVGIVLMVLDIPDQVYRCQHGVNLSSLVPSDPGAALSAVAFAYGAWLTDRPLVAPVAFAVEAVVSVIFFAAWVRIGSRIAASWVWLVVEAAATLGLLYVYGWSAISITVIISTVMLLSCCAGRRGAIVAAAFVVAGAGLSFRTLSMLVYAIAYLAVGVFSRSLLLEQGRATRLHAAAELQAAVAREQIRASDEVQTRLSATLDDARAMAGALARNLTGTGRGESATLAQRLVDGLTRARAECDALSRGLSDDLPGSLPAACRAAVAEFEQNSPTVGVALTVPDETSDTSPQTRREVVRALRELLENVRRHSHADSVDVEVARTHDTVTLTVVDNGVGLPNGFDADGFRRTGHFGLIGLAERAEWSGGSLDVQAPGRGTTVRLTLPRWLETDTKGDAR